MTWPRALRLGAAAGLVLGASIFLSYGLVLLGPLALAVLWLAGSWRPLLPAVAGAVVVVALFAWGGFWWLEGQQTLVDRYYQGIAAQRPQQYWVWANLAVGALVVGPAVVAGVGLAVHRRAWPGGGRRGAAEPMQAPTGAAGHPGRATWWLALAAATALVVADLTALTKSETERIWLPWLQWLVPLATLLPVRTHRLWLGVQVGWTLGIALLLRTTW